MREATSAKEYMPVEYGLRMVLRAYLQVDPQSILHLYDGENLDPGTFPGIVFLLFLTRYYEPVSFPYVVDYNPYIHIYIYTYSL